MFDCLTAQQQQSFSLFCDSTIDTLAAEPNSAFLERNAAARLGALSQPWVPRLRSRTFIWLVTPSLVLPGCSCSWNSATFLRRSQRSPAAPVSFAIHTAQEIPKLKDFTREAFLVWSRDFDAYLGRCQADALKPNHIRHAFVDTMVSQVL
jgi:hypothetical protein